MTDGVEAERLATHLREQLGDRANIFVTSPEAPRPGRLERGA
jgi:hypothetical protein